MSEGFTGKGKGERGRGVKVLISSVGWSFSSHSKKSGKERKPFLNETLILVVSAKEQIHKGRLGIVTLPDAV